MCRPEEGLKEEVPLMQVVAPWHSPLRVPSCLQLALAQCCLLIEAGAGRGLAPPAEPCPPETLSEDLHGDLKFWVSKWRR